MLQLADDVRAALEDSHSPGYKVTAYYGADLTVADVPITTDGSITFAADADVQGSGTISLARDGGESLVPQSKTDPLAPYGQELSIERTISRGGQTWSVPLGRFRITRVPSAKEYFRLYPAARQLVGWAAQLEVKDRLEMIQADDFPAATAPVPGNTTWDEIRRISPIPIVTSLPDRALPAGIVYQSRAEAVATLAKNLGGVPAITRQGALTVRPANQWLTATVPVFTINGTIDIDDGMANDLYNSVVVSTSNDPTILGVAEILDESNPLAVTRPIGRRTYKAQDPLITTQLGADEAASTMLARLSTRQSRTAKVTCLPRPDLELGDFGEVADPVSGRVLLGEIAGMSFSLDPFAEMTLDLIVSEAR